MLLTRRPGPLRDGSRWQRTAGVGDDVAPDAAGQVRFYTVVWDPPAAAVAGQLTLPARRATTATANMLIDLPAAVDGRVVVSLIYQSADRGVVQEWDGDAYHDLAPLPATRDEEGALRWHRTSFELDPAIRFDYQGAPGVNVLLQLTNTPTVHGIEATPLD
jgi:hypothetical protein